MAVGFQLDAFQNDSFQTSGGVNYSLTCANGGYAVTGQAATLKRGISLVCANGSYAVTGQAAALVYVDRGWYIISNTQTPDWNAIATASTPGWAEVSDAQTPDWTAIATTNTPQLGRGFRCPNP